MQKLKTCKVCGSWLIFTVKKYSVTPDLNQTWRHVFSTVLNSQEPFPIHLALCAKCGFLFYKNVFDFSELEKLYANEGRFDVTRKKNSERGGNEEVRRLMKFFEKHVDFSAVTSILDIGAGDFTVVDQMLELAPTAEFAALDPCFESTTYKERVKVYRTMIEEFDPERSYSFVSAIHILEHVSDLNLFMEKLSKLSANLLYVEVPFQVGPGLLLNRAVNTQHINYFSPKTLATLLKRHGFRVLETEFDKEGYEYNGMPGMIRMLAEKQQEYIHERSSGFNETLWYLFTPFVFGKYVLKRLLQKYALGRQ